MKMSQEKYDQHLEECAGYCLECDDITTDDVEPEAMNERCEECDGMVYGMENALIYEYIEISDDEDEQDVGIISLSDDED